MSISENNISDISPLASLTSLKEPDIYGNHITDYSTIQNMTGFEVLFLDWVSDEEVEKLYSLKKLRYLGFYSEELLSDETMKKSKEAWRIAL